MIRSALLFSFCSILFVACDGGSATPQEGELAGSCQDGADNDGDGDFDCLDSGCFGAPACISTPVDGGPPVTMDCECDLFTGCDMACACDPECAEATDLCSDECPYANDGECDDGGEGALYAVCSLGTDCADCGPRDPDAVCVDTCDVNECGSGGCGRSCGTCGSGERCASGRCEVSACIPDCTDRTCGTDPACGTSCGSCGADEVCRAGACETDACVPDCGGRECGNDGCGGSCGSGCSAGESCSSGSCVGGCTPSCGGRECGSDGCAGTCGSGCSAGETCASGTCERDCFFERVGYQSIRDGDWSDFNYCEIRITQTNAAGVESVQTIVLETGSAPILREFVGSCDYDARIEVGCSMRGGVLCEAAPVTRSGIPELDFPAPMPLLIRPVRVDASECFVVVS